MVDEFRGKKHVIVLKTTQGDVVVGTDDLGELGNQQWFREFLNIEAGEVAEVQVQQPVQVPQRVQANPFAARMPIPKMPQPQQRIPSTYLDIVPNDMNVDVWNSLTQEQQATWMEKYNMR